MIKRLLALAFAVMAVLLMSGCATGLPFAEVAAKMPDLKPGDGRICFLRSSSMLGAAIQPQLRLNGEVVGESKPGGFFFVDRPAGNYIASASTETENTLSFTLAAGETKYLRSAVHPGILVGRVTVDLEQPDKALAELPSLKQTTLAKN
jgi:hypothetical protein